jgi:hypothetical protein
VNFLGKGSRVPCKFWLHFPPCFLLTLVREGELPGQGVQGTVPVLPRLLCKAPTAPYQPGLGREVNCLGHGSRILCRSCLDCSIRPSLLLTNLG